MDGYILYLALDFNMFLWIYLVENRNLDENINKK